MFKILPSLERHSLRRGHGELGREGKGAGAGVKGEGGEEGAEREAERRKEKGKWR